MNTLDRKKLNILVHLAKIDGKFDSSEQKLLQVFLKEKGLNKNTIEEEEVPMHLDEWKNADQRIELLYWALKLVQADQIIHKKEILFCKNLAQKFSFSDELIDHYVYKQLPNFQVFEKEVTKFLLKD